MTLHHVQRRSPHERFGIRTAAWTTSVFSIGLLLAVPTPAEAAGGARGRGESPRLAAADEASPRTPTEAARRDERPIAAQVQELIDRMTLEEKVAQLVDKAPAIPRLGIPAYDYWNEALHGVVTDVPTTSFPQGVALASTWNPEILHRVATAISDEARALEHHGNGKNLTYWSPVINQLRDPRWGRFEEGYSEDPYLTSRLAVAFVKGMQGDHPRYLKTVATPKHFVANNSEFDRRRSAPPIDEATLREYYYPAFRAAIQEGKAASVMAAYNGVNGVPVTVNGELLTGVLRREWSFDGYVVSDCDAVHEAFQSHRYVATQEAAAAMALRAGTDLNCGSYFRRFLPGALQQGLITIAEIDRALSRVLTARFRLGEFAPPEQVPYTRIPADVIESPAHQALALDAARESIVLLRNSAGVLPVARSGLASIAVIGPQADRCVLGGYSGRPSRCTSPLYALERRFHRWIEAETLSAKGGQVQVVDGRRLGTIHRGDWVRFDDVDFGRESGPVSLAIRGASGGAGGEVRIRLGSLGPDGQAVGTCRVEPGAASRDWRIIPCGQVEAQGRQTVFLSFSGAAAVDLLDIDAFGLIPPSAVSIAHVPAATVTGPASESALEAAAAAAAAADLALLLVGTDKTVAGEERDRTSLDLPGAQAELVKRVTQANPRTVVALVTNGPVTLTGLESEVRSLVAAWYGGQAQGEGLVDVIFGDYNPAGRLTTTWYRSLADIPPIDDYDVKKGRTYLYFQGQPLFPFGHGSSYTRFQYSGLSVEAPAPMTAHDTARVSFDLKNIGLRAGDEVVQLYVRDLQASVRRPLQELKGFRRLRLAPGESRRVSFELKAEDLAFYDVARRGWRVEPGAFEVRVGASSADIRLTGGLEIAAGDPGVRR